MSCGIADAFLFLFAPFLPPPPLIQSVVFLPVSISPPSRLCYESERWIGVVGKQRRAVRVMNESCPPGESEGTVVYTAGYRLMFSYRKVGVSAGWTSGGWGGGPSLGMRERGKAGRMTTGGRGHLVGRDKKGREWPSGSCLWTGALPVNVKKGYQVFPLRPDQCQRRCSFA